MLTERQQMVLVLVLVCVGLSLLKTYPTMLAYENKFHPIIGKRIPFNISHFTNDTTSQKPEDARLKHIHNWTWNALFSYVPYAVEECRTLFNGSGEHTPEFTVLYNEFLAKVKTFRVRDGTIANYKEELLAYIESVQAPFVRTVCETGFNAGHTAFVWLVANPATHVYSFDMGTHGYAKPMAQYLMDRFPGRLNMTWGNSVQTLPKFREEHPDVKCDLMVIDGGHFYDVCKSDLHNFRQMANPDNILILDDYPDIEWGVPPKLDRCWDEAKRNAEILEIYKCHFHPLRVGFAVGRMVVD